MQNKLYSRYRRSFLLSIDLLIIVFSFFGAFLLRFDFILPGDYSSFYLVWLPIFIVLKLSIFYFFGLYKVIWRFTSIWELLKIVKAVTFGSVTIILCLWFTSGFEGFPRSILFLDYMLTIFATSVSRLSVRIYFTHFYNRPLLSEESSKIKLLLIGAGKTGEKIAREIIDTPASPYSIAGFIDDDPSKKNALLHGYQVLGTVADLVNIRVKFDEILITACGKNS